MIQKHLLNIAAIAILLSDTQVANGQGIAVNTTGAAADSSAMLDVSSTSKGVLVPRIASTASITSPATGLMIYNTTTNQFNYYNGTAWTVIGGASGTVTSVMAGTGLSGGTITSTGTISMPNTGTSGTYGSATQVPVFTTDAQGRVTGVTNTTITAGGSGVTFISSFNNGNTSNTGNWYAPLTGAVAGSTDEPLDATVSFSARTITVAPIGCTFKELSLASVVAPYSGGSGSGTGTEIVTLYKNGSATSLTCSITGMTYGVLYSSGSCSDVTHTVSVSPGDQLSIQLSESNITALEEYTAILKCQ